MPQKRIIVSLLKVDVPPSRLHGNEKQIRGSAQKNHPTVFHNHGTLAGLVRHSLNRSRLARKLFPTATTSSTPLNLGATSRIQRPTLFKPMFTRGPLAVFQISKSSSPQCVGQPSVISQSSKETAEARLQRAVQSSSLGDSLTG